MKLPILPVLLDNKIIFEWSIKVKKVLITLYFDPTIE